MNENLMNKRKPNEGIKEDTLVIETVNVKKTILKEEGNWRYEKTP